jgi:ABC-type transporter Mla MlaB component
MMQNEKIFHCAIEGRMTSAQANALREKILLGIMDTTETEIDLSQVSEIDHAGVVLMMEAKLAASVCDGTLRFIGHSKPVLEILEKYNVSRFFDVPPLADATLH